MNIAIIGCGEVGYLYAQAISIAGYLYNSILQSLALNENPIKAKNPTTKEALAWLLETRVITKA